MENRKLLEVKNLVTSFTSNKKTSVAVNDISFEISKGETIGIVGESGSGKSVTSLSIMRLISAPAGKINSGEILFHNSDSSSTDLLKLTEAEMRQYRGNKIAMVFQEPMTSLNPVFTCGDQVMEAIMLHQNLSKKQAKEKTISLFQEVQLPRPEAIFNSYPHQISGGQKQRVMIAMALCCEPSLLIADEPTTALDVTVQKTILDLLLKIQKQRQMGLIFITHDLGVIAELADKIAVMYKGKIVEQGAVLDIFSSPKHPYTKGLLACRPSLEKRSRKLPTISDFMEIDSQGEIKEIDQNIEYVLKNYEISEEEREKARKKLYHKNPILEVKNIKTYFAQEKSFFQKTVNYVKAVDDVSFDVYPGETLGLVGESGCGKTTLGRTILNLIEPTSGSILYHGQDISKLSENSLREIRKEMQIIFQDPYSSLNPRLSIGEAIMEPMRIHGVLQDNKERKNKVNELLECVNLNPNHFNRYPHEFSGGQRQRICIARAIALNPKFIICDESVSALDVSVQAQVLNLLNQLKKDFDFTYIFISHDLSVVKFMSDRMVVMNQGKIEEIGDPEEIYKNPSSSYTQKLINAIPQGRLEDIRQGIERKKSIA